MMKEGDLAVDWRIQRVQFRIQRAIAGRMMISQESLGCLTAGTYLWLWLCPLHHLPHLAAAVQASSALEWKVA